MRQFCFSNFSFHCFLVHISVFCIIKKKIIGNSGGQISNQIPLNSCITFQFLPVSACLSAFSYALFILFWLSRHVFRSFPAQKSLFGIFENSLVVIKLIFCRKYIAKYFGCIAARVAAAAALQHVERRRRHAVGRSRGAMRRTTSANVFGCDKDRRRSQETRCRATKRENILSSSSAATAVSPPQFRGSRSAGRRGSGNVRPWLIESYEVPAHRPPFEESQKKIFRGPNGARSVISPLSSVRRGKKIFEAPLEHSKLKVPFPPGETKIESSFCPRMGKRKRSFFFFFNKNFVL